MKNRSLKAGGRLNRWSFKAGFTVLCVAHRHQVVHSVYDWSQRQGKFSARYNWLLTRLTERLHWLCVGTAGVRRYWHQSACFLWEYCRKQQKKQKKWAIRALVYQILHTKNHGECCYDQCVESKKYKILLLGKKIEGRPKDKELKEGERGGERKGDGK